MHFTGFPKQRHRDEIRTKNTKLERSSKHLYTIREIEKYTTITNSMILLRLKSNRGKLYQKQHLHMPAAIQSLEVTNTQET